MESVFGKNSMKFGDRDKRGYRNALSPKLFSLPFCSLKRTAFCFLGFFFIGLEE